MLSSLRYEPVRRLSSSVLIFPSIWLAMFHILEMPCVIPAAISPSQVQSHVILIEVHTVYRDGLWLRAPGDEAQRLIQM